MATWDPKGRLIRGYLHVFVNYQKHYDWCQRNNEPFVPPVPPHQQSIDQQIASSSFQAPDNFQVPAGYTLVPQNPTPPPAFQVPAGFKLVPQHYEVTCSDRK